MAKINKVVPGAVKIRTMKNGNQYIYIRFAGGNKFIATGLEYNRENALKAEEVLKMAYLEGRKSEASGKKPSAAPQNNFFQHFEEFLNFKKLKGVSPRTLKAYSYIINSVFKEDFDIKDRINYSGKNMSKIEYLIYSSIIDMKEKFALKSINQYLRCVNCYTNYLFEEELIDKPIRLKKYRFNEPEQEIKIYSNEEVSQIFWEILKSKYLKKRTLALWFLFLLYTGMRKGESAKLQWSNVDFEKRMLLIPNKIHHNRFDYLPISTKLLKLLKLLYADSQKRTYRSQYLFERGFSTFTIQILKIQLKLGIKEDRRLIHSIRKTYATNLYNLRDEDKLDGTMIPELMRHTDKRLTDRIYREKNSKNIIKMLDKAGL